jgi:membrane associated rhomboid family serine protease
LRLWHDWCTIGRGVQLFPIGDENEPGAGFHPLTILIILMNVVVFLALQGFGENGFTCGYALVPYEVTRGTDLVQPVNVSFEGQTFQIPHCPGPSPIYLTFLSAMFMHANLAHIFGNMLFLWIFGDNLERRFGPIVFLAFYPISGVVASLAQIALNTESQIPTLGASGAIAGVLGGYLVLFPGNRVSVFVLGRVTTVPAIVMIGLWALEQFVALAGTVESAGGVAYGAHVGGFVCGLVLALVLRGVLPGRRSYAIP